MKEVVIASACRTAIGAFGGTLKDIHAATIAGETMKAAVERAGIDPAVIDEIDAAWLDHHWEWKPGEDGDERTLGDRPLWDWARTFPAEFSQRRYRRLLTDPPLR